MFSPDTYRARRAELAQKVGSGLILLIGNVDSPFNYTDNIYPFRQDSSFLYFFGLDLPGLAALIDADSGEAVLFGDDGGLDSIVWTGPLPTLAEQAAEVAVARTEGLAALAGAIAAARGQGRSVHYLPPYRGEQRIQLAALLDQPVAAIDAGASDALARAVIELRAVKSAAEIAEMENALEIAYRMHLLALRSARPGVREQEIVGLMQGLAASQGRALAYNIIFSRDGHILHNHGHGHVLKSGDLVVNDAGAESPLHYASDITRTIPVGGRFNERQKVVYQAVLDAQLAAIAAMKPGVPYREVHDLAARVLVEGLAPLGLFRGDAAEVVASGAYALVFPHGLGHLIGLDVHDLEGLGEDRVGYGEGVTRSADFGRRSLRLGRPLREGWVVTVEPGAYFIPALIERWEAEGRHAGQIDYAVARQFADFGGIRIEDDVLVTADGARVLGKPIPKTIAEVEALASA
ncbi:aminopeptidase P family protein [Chitinimonas koreensis]|uniref:aminopeptidase P family protein n=1 Tax=Chitinimonas koreensis TaxID=356302 RepID=UPI0004169FDB|nr:aminopeptidase P family protein [Chitinimonas koreensis]QNM97554.1 aminopeptidase P family protein [Chitinimonas koreensis]